MKFLVFYVPYGKVGSIVAAEMSEKEVANICGHLLTGTKLPNQSEFLSVSEWMDGAVVGEDCRIPNGFYQHIVRIK